MYTCILYICIHISMYLSDLPEASLHAGPSVALHVYARDVAIPVYM